MPAYRREPASGCQISLSIVEEGFQFIHEFADVFEFTVSKGLIGADLIAKMRTWKHSGFHVYVGPSPLQKEDGVRVALYIVRAPASASRIQHADNGLLNYLAKGSLPNARCETLFETAGQIFDYLEWIARVTSHIPNKELSSSIIMALTPTRIVARELNSTAPLSRQHIVALIPSFSSTNAMIL